MSPRTPEVPGLEQPPGTVSVKNPPRGGSTLWVSRLTQAGRIQPGFLAGLVAIAATALIIALFGGAHLLGTGSGGRNESGNKSSIDSAYDFRLPDIEGKKHSLDEYDGKLALVHFWASWCAPCIDELPRWLKLSERYHGKPLQMIAISLDKNWTDARKVYDVDGRSSELRDVVFLLDAEQKVSEKYGSFQFPETYLLSTQGKIITKWVGSQDWSSPALLQNIDAHLPGAPR